MGKEKDAAERQLESYNDVFADIFNALLFDGDPVIDENELSDTSTVSQFKAAGGLHQEERDEAKRWREGTLCLALLGLENETKSESAMPLRVIGYDGASYKEQLIQQEEDHKAGRPAQPFYPVVTLVLNFGLKRWNGKTSLRECLTIPEKLRPFVEDYRIHVVDVAFLSDEELSRFQSVFRIPAEYLTRRQRGEEFPVLEGPIRHTDALCKLMEAVTGEAGFLEKLDEMRRSGKEPTDMTNFFEPYEKRAEARGEARGLAEGEARGLVKGEVRGVAASVRVLMRKMNLSAEEAMDMLEIPAEKRNACMELLNEKDAS